MARFLPYGRQFVDDDDIAAVVKALSDDYLTTGPRVEEFELALTTVTGASQAVVCNSGTAALHLASMALGLGPGDQVVVPTMTFLATANAPRLTGAEVVFADVDPDSGLMTPETFAEALARAPRAKAVFPVHLNGQVCDMTGIAELADLHDVAIVEDGCHALGARDQDGVLVGACPHSAMTAFSFHPVKTIAMGEGGAVTTANLDLAERCRQLRNHGIERNPNNFSTDNADFAFCAGGKPNPWFYEMAEPGYNYRAPDILCALGKSQLIKLPRFLTYRRAIAEIYDTILGPLAPAVVPAGRSGAIQPGWHLYVALVDFKALGRSRREVMEHMKTWGVGTQVHYVPVHLQPYYRKVSPTPKLPGAMAYYERALSLPIFPTMTEEDIARVADALASALGLSHIYTQLATGTVQ
ncbi:MAG: UDP-4-amino-4,6-dideoxy-N-acetyl-beta-L-altrosamine transaminase [Maricaulaceae bacterium]